MILNRICRSRFVIGILTFILITLIVHYQINDTIDETVTVVKPYNRVNACLFILCREKDLSQLASTISTFEKRFNSKYMYDYVIINEREFSDYFKLKIQRLTKSKVKFGIVPYEQWSYPEFIDQNKAKLDRETMGRTGVSYGGSESYRFMCRYYSGYFFRHPLVLEYDYFWRIEPGAKYLCNINYDPFRLMTNNGYEYGFTLLPIEHPITVPTLWNETMKFIKENPELIDSKSNNLKFVTNPDTNYYNYCQFWSNFEIASFTFFRSEKYLKYFEHLEKAGGFFYERWGDAPVHTIATSLFLPKSKVHFFNDISYRHEPIQHCTTDRNVLKGCSWYCTLFGSFDWDSGSCLKVWNNT